MPKEMREYENQEMESNESPVPQEDEEHTVEGIQKEQASAMEEPADPAIPPQTSARRSRATPRSIWPDGPLWWPLGRSCRRRPRRKRIRTPCWT